MHYRLGATALALISGAQLALAQECPPGYAKSSKVGWANCPTPENESLQCATLEVPLDWTKPTGGEKLKLRLVRQPAASGRVNAKSIIINPGGPGESGIKSVVDGGSGYQDVVGDGFHIIGFDPRGVGLTTPYTCPEAAGDVGEYNTDDGFKAAFEYNTAQAKDCANVKYGSDLIGTAFVARDIKAIADALGEDGLIRYWGYSYGTLLGATLSAMFPNQMDRVILDGNINPTDYYRGLGSEGSTDVDKGVQRFFEQCAEAGSPSCAVAVAGQSAKQLQNTFDSFLKSLDYSHAKQVRDALYEALYFRSPTAFRDFATTLNKYYKDPTTIRRRALSRRQLDWKPDYAAVKTDLAISGITCGDVVQRFAGSQNNFKKWLAAYEKTSKYGGDIAISLFYQCSVWSVNAKERFTGAFSGIRTKTPILFLNSQYDPVTPLVSAQNSAMGFMGARVLQSSGVGHCTSANESPELNRAIKTYMIEGTFPLENKVYAPKVTNVFKTNAKRTLNGPTLSRRNVEYPAFFENERVVVKRQNNIPAGCTKVAASSTSVASASLSSSVSLSALIASAVSSTPIASASTSSVAPASLSSFVSSSASSTAMASASSAVPAGSSLIVSASSSGSSSSVLAATSVDVLSASISAPLAIGSASAPVSVQTSIDFVSSAPVSAKLASSSTASLSATMQSASSSDSALSTASSVSSFPSVSTSVPSDSDSSTMTIASPSASLLEALSTKTPVDPYKTGVIYATGTKPLVSQTSYPSSIGPNGQMYDSYGTDRSASYNNYPASSAGLKGYSSYDDSKKATSTPCPTPAWSSQSGYIPRTQTYTTTTVQTITKCSPNKKDCPVNSATPTVLVTETKTAITVVAVPTTTVYVTSVVDVCSTGLQTKTVTITQTCSTGCTSKPTGIPQGYTTTVKYCDACATPSSVTVTFCTACAGTPTPPVQVLSVPSVTGYNSQAKPTTSAVPGYSKPGVGVYSVQNATVVNSYPTPAKTVTLQTSVASTGAYVCLGGSCGGVPTSYTPAQFTGAAVREKGDLPFIAHVVFAGFAFIV